MRLHLTVAVLFTILNVVFSHCGIILNEENKYVRGDEILGRNSLPFLANLRLRETGQTFCTGTIIDHSKILTSRECFMDRELLDTPYVNPKKLDLVEVQVGHNSKNSGTIHAIDSYRMVNNSYPFNINDQSHKGFVIITLKEDIPIDDDNTIFICQTKSVPNDTTFYVVGQNLQEAASGDYNINNGYSVGSMNRFPCHNYPDMLCLYSHETGLVSINAGGPVLVYRPESRTTGRYYQVGFAVGGFIMEYADSRNVIHSIGYAHYEPTQDFCHWGIHKLALDYGLFYCRDV